MLYCPFFECLAYSTSKCEKYNGCAGCQTFSSCENCGRQETLIEGIKVPCEHRANHDNVLSGQSSGSPAGR